MLQSKVSEQGWQQIRQKLVMYKAETQIQYFWDTVKFFASFYVYNTVLEIPKWWYIPRGGILTFEIVHYEWAQFLDWIYVVYLRFYKRMLQ